MMPLRVDAALARKLGAGEPALILAPGASLPDLPPLIAIEVRDGILAEIGTAGTGVALLPAAARLLALVAPDPVAAFRLAPLLPAGLPVVTGPDPLPAMLRLLAARLAEEIARRGAAEAARDAALRVLGNRAPPLPELLMEEPPGGRSPARVVQPLGRPAEGLCRLALHLAEAAAGPASLLRARLVAGGRVRAAWTVPGPALMPGWLTLDLPEPARLGAAEATLEVACEAGGEDRLVLSAGGEGPASLAQRLWTATPGRNVLPRHFDWAASDAPLAGLPYAVAEAELSDATAEGATLAVVAAGAEPGRLLAEVPAGAEAAILLPALPAAPLDLLRSVLTVLAGDAASVQAALRVETPAGGVESGWRPLDRAASVSIELPLPGTAARLRIGVRNGGTLPAVLEVSRLVLIAGAAGEVLPPPSAEPLRRPARSTPGLGVPLPAAGAAARIAVPAVVPSGAALAPAGVVTWQDVRLQQHLVSPDGAYRHLDLVVTGLVADAGLWRQIRTKLFARRGVTGLEFREAQGWPQMFDVWPGAAIDGFGPFWRLETERPAASLAGLATPHDRALIAALLEVLPAVAARGAALAGLPVRETEDWAERGRTLSAAVASGAHAGGRP